jgi:hypothetical protein
MRHQPRETCEFSQEMKMRVICRSRVVIGLLWAVLAPAAATAQQSAGTETETIATLRNRDLNGTVSVDEKVVTHRTRTNDDERVIIETYLPSIEAGRLALARRVRRVTTVTHDGSKTVEDTEERNRASPSEPLRVVRRSVTTMRRSGTDSYVSERQVFELDVNGRFVPVLSQVEQASGK